MKKLNYLFAFVLLFTFSCGGGSSTTEESETEMATEEMVAEEAQKDIVSLAVETDALSTLVAAVKAAGLVETLQGDSGSSCCTH